MDFRGIGVSPGIAMGPAVLIRREDFILPPDVAPEMDLKAAYEAICDALESVAAGMDAQAEISQGPTREVLAATAAIARDRALWAAARSKLSTGHDRFTALWIAVEDFANRLKSLGGYMAERALDLYDVHRRAHARLMGVDEPGVPLLTEPSIIVATDLAPADMVALDHTKVLGIVTEQGGPTSHTAILANQWAIPAVLQCEGVLDAEPLRVAIDGVTGLVETDPVDDAVYQFRQRHTRRQALATSSEGIGLTRDGTHIQLLANVGSVDDALTAAKADVEGIGLFRTEFLYMDRMEAPSFEEQVDAYTRVLNAFEGRKVIIRTLDAGADKPLRFLSVGQEHNPALGVRGYRLHELLPHIFDDQLRAIATAQEATGHAAWVMAPMIATPHEAASFTAQARSHGLQHVGIMAEVPSAAMRVEYLLRDADFISIGTNDLSQYLFAADRMDGRLSTLLDTWQPPLWQLTAQAAASARKMDRRVGICGEACGDPLLAPLAVGAGVTSLSMAPAKIPMVRASLALHTVEQCKAMLDAAIASDCPHDARQSISELADPAVISLI